MGIKYNRFAGRSVDRLTGLSDGLFSVAMTLLVLDLKAPAAEIIHGNGDLWAALVTLSPRLLVYMMSFMTLGIFWVGQQTQLEHLAESDRLLTWVHLAFLFAVSLMPFSTTLMAELIQYRVALLVYRANILLLGILVFVSWRYAVRQKFLKEDTPEELGKSIERRVVVAQVLYASGAALCVVNTYWSIGFIILVQLNYAVGPTRGFLSRL